MLLQGAGAEALARAALMEHRVTAVPATIWDCQQHSQSCRAARDLQSPGSQCPAPEHHQALADPPCQLISNRLLLPPLQITCSTCPASTTTGLCDCSSTSSLPPAPASPLPAPRQAGGAPAPLHRNSDVGTRGNNDAQRCSCGFYLCAP